MNAIHQVVSRQLDPVEHGVLTIGTINAGTATNIIPDRLTMTGTMRSMTPETRQRLRTELRRACSLVETFGASFELLIEEGYPVTVNDPDATEVAFETMRDLLGPSNALESPLIMGSEDFSYMAEEAPGCFMMVGVKDPSWEKEYPVHTPTFRLHEGVLPLGSSLLAGAAMRWLER